MEWKFTQKVSSSIFSAFVYVCVFPSVFFIIENYYIDPVQITVKVRDQRRQKYGNGTDKKIGNIQNTSQHSAVYSPCANS